MKFVTVERLTTEKKRKPRYHSRVFIMTIDHHRWLRVSEISATGTQEMPEIIHNDVRDIFPTHIYRVNLFC